MSHSSIHLVPHSLIAAKMATLREKTTPMMEFRRALEEIAILLLSEAAKEWETTATIIETPLGVAPALRLARPVVFAPILRAGVGLLEGMLRLLPDAAVGHIGLYRDEVTLQPVKYYARFPAHLNQAQVLLLDPMLATGRSATKAASLLKEQGATHLQFLCVVACEEGIDHLEEAHPELPIYCAAVDPELNQHGYIVPGLGDAGDRYFGTT